MAKRAHAYPQAHVDAADVVDVAVVGVAPSAVVRDALLLARKRDAAVVTADGHTILREDLARASLLELDDLPATAVARPLPTLDARAGEVSVRRLLAAGAPFVIVRGRAGRLGAVAGRGSAQGAAVSANDRVARGVPPDTRALLATVARVAGELGARAFLVGGMVRDLWRGAPVARRDLDLVVEGDGPGVARRLAHELHGALLEHRHFLTASVEIPTAGRIDVATARAERYATRGALPRVVPASIDEDLGRRDFSVNAMAIELGSGAWGLLDPLGGRADLGRRRLRVLHPLSYVEDPTRMFRAARYAVRLGLAPDRATLRAQALAVGLAPYPALSGARIVNEIGLVLAEARPDLVLARLGAWGVFRLLDPRYRFTRETGRRAAEVPRALGWTRERGLEPPAVALAILAIVAQQPRQVARAALARLAFTGEPLLRLTRALDESPGLIERLRGAAPSARARELRNRTVVELAWLWLVGDAGVRGALDWYLGLGPSPVALSGDDVVALGVPRGPAVARLLAELRDARLDGRLTDRAAEIEHVRQYLTKGG